MALADQRPESVGWSASAAGVEHKTTSNAPQKAAKRSHIRTWTEYRANEPVSTGTANREFCREKK
jgi:hypothetical protein